METNMSKIVAIYRTDKSEDIPEDPVQIGPRQLAIEAGKITVSGFPFDSSFYSPGFSRKPHSIVIGINGNFWNRGRP